MLKKYFSQLLFLEKRFPLDEGGLIAVPFSWSVLFDINYIVEILVAVLLKFDMKNC